MDANSERLPMLKDRHDYDRCPKCGENLCSEAQRAMFNLNRERAERKRRNREAHRAR